MDLISSWLQLHAALSLLPAVMSAEGSAKASKILVIGPPCGRIKDLATKVKAINDKHGPFEALLCLGDLFRPFDGGESELSDAETELLDGKTKLPIPIYFFLSASPLHPRIQDLVRERWLGSDDDRPIEIVSGIFFCGKARVVKMPSGLRVAVAGGNWNASKWNESMGGEVNEVEDLLDPFITPSSIHRLLANPSFRQAEAPKPVQQDDEPPQSLAAARAQMASKAQALQQQADEKEALSGKLAIDILLTTTWPTGITLFSKPDKLPHATSRMWGAPPIAQLARACLPRYHFSLAPGSCGLPEDETSVPLGIAGLDDTQDGKTLRQMGLFWEREPYKNDGVSHPFCNTTRFITLARLANADKQRWFMALNLVPAGNISAADARAQASKATAGITPSPYSSGGYGGVSMEAKRKAAAEGAIEDIDAGPNFRWSGDAGRGKKQRKGGNLPSRPDGPLPDGPGREKRPLAIPVGPQDCWFCLSNPQCAKHLIVAIGTECYIAMPKGQLPPTSDPLSPVPGGGHVLIIPIEHFPSLLGHPDAELARPIGQEMQAWKDALRKAYASFDAVSVSWEVCKTVGSRAGHMQSQVVPIPRSMSEGIQDYFREAAVKWEYDFIEDQAEVKEILQISEDPATRQQRCDYIRLDFDDCIWIMLLKDRRFNLQFPRETLASFLNVADRADWKRCARSEAIETAEAKAFKVAFEEFSKGVGE